MNKLMLHLLLWLSSAFLAGDELPSLTLDQALGKAMAQEDFRHMLDAYLEMEAGEIERVTTYQNPELSLSSEDIDQAGIATHERLLVVSQKIDLFGLRKKRILAAQALQEAGQFRNQEREQAMKALVARQFYLALYAGERVGILETRLVETWKLSDVITLREEAGEVSGYHRLRLDRELAKAGVRLAEERAAFDAARKQLGVLLAMPGDFRLEGELLPAETPRVDADRHPSLLASERELAAASLQESEARQRLLRDITLEAGIKQVAMDGVSDTGTFLGLRVALPVWNRNNAAVMAARARGSIVRGEMELKSQQNNARIAALEVRLAELRKALAQHQNEVVALSRQLIDIAILAYAEDEMDLQGLLDAYQGLAADELQERAMAAEIRILTLELRGLGGDL